MTDDIVITFAGNGFVVTFDTGGTLVAKTKAEMLEMIDQYTNDPDKSWLRES